MESSAVRFTIFILLGVAAISGSAALIGTDPDSASASSGRAPTELPSLRDRPTASAQLDPTLDAPHRGIDDAEAPKAFDFDIVGTDFAPPPPQMGRERWSWKDDRTQIVFEGCTPVARDERIDPLDCIVEAEIDRAGLEALEAHFGFEMHRLRTFRVRGDAQVDDAMWEDLLAQHASALAKHGIVLEGNRVAPDFPWLVQRAVPFVAPLAQAIVRAWRDTDAPAAGAAAPGNYPRSDTRVEALTSFVQRAIPYAEVTPSPDGLERCGLRTPGATLADGGDCDSKVLLLAALLRAADPRLPLVLVTLTIDGRPHMLLGVGIRPTPCAATLTHGGLEYVLIETTSAVGVGFMAPDYNDARLEEFTVIP
ncbi:MAG: hypothetical protein GC172_06530 [Phycisphaera sp.]|nr:hypothetical protein [Phycisphaera sp.]